MPHQPRDAFTSPRFAQPATFMRLPYQPEPVGADVAILGVPFDSGTSYRPGARLGPREIRAQSSLIRPYNHFQRIAPFDRLTVVDAGDVDASPVDLARAHAAIERAVGQIAASGAIPLIAGGDHSISLPILRVLARAHGPLALVQFDSHIDTWEQDFGSPYFHGSPFWHAVNDGLVNPSRFIQVGIRGPMYGPDDFAFQRARGIIVRDMVQIREEGLGATVDDIRRVAIGPTYVTFDIDAIDPAFAPGTGTPEVGGFTSEEGLRLVRGLGAAARLGSLKVVGADVVEVSPPFDGPGQITSVLAANLLFELLCVIANGRS